MLSASDIANYEKWNAKIRPMMPSDDRMLGFPVPLLLSGKVKEVYSQEEMPAQNAAFQKEKIPASRPGNAGVVRES